jgi:two-component system response regulator YesN
MEVIVDYIGKNLRNGVTVNELADVVYMNPSYLSVLFKKEMGETITEYINRVRIDKAKKMLQQVNFKIYDIAQELGYQNPSYFAFQFKKSTGYTPAEYRRVVNHKSTTR